MNLILHKPINNQLNLCSIKPIILHLIILTLINVVSNEFNGGIERIYYDRYDKMISLPSDPLENEVPKKQVVNYSDLTDLKLDPIDLSNIGKCLIRCVMKTYHQKACPKSFRCYWKCLFNKPDTKVKLISQEPFHPPVPSSQSRGSFRSRSSAHQMDGVDDQGDDKLTQNDIVQFGICGSKCLIRHLPIGLFSLVQLCNCIVIKCFCGSTF